MIIYKGFGLINKIINKLPVELHIPGYQYCGPGTKLRERLARGDPGINPLDTACKEHDIAYSKHREDIQARNAADRVLAEKAWQRVKSSDASLGERAAALVVTNIMKVKSKMGMGLGKKRKCSKKKLNALKQVIKRTAKSVTPSNNSSTFIKSALNAARTQVNEAGGKKNIQIPRILQVPKIGGFLPALVPIFAGLSALGSLAGGAAGIAQAVNKANAAREQIEEQKRHNKKMEMQSLGKGLYLKPYKKGYGIYVKPCGIKKRLKKVMHRKKKFR